jgi:predicted RNase H-like HicB family nuclease
MEKIIMNVEKTADYYSAYSVNCDGIYAAGESLDAVKRDTEDAISIIKSEYPQEQWPEALRGDYELEYKLDIVSFLNYYSRYLSLAGLGRITGINQKQLSNYLNGRAVPRQKQIDRISQGIRRFADELRTMTL